MVREVFMHYRNVVLSLNNNVMALVGFHPWMTLSALAHLRSWTRIERAINAIYRDPHHCRVAAQGWEQDALNQRHAGPIAAAVGNVVIAGLVWLAFWR